MDMRHFLSGAVKLLDEDRWLLAQPITRLGADRYVGFPHAGGATNSVQLLRECLLFRDPIGDVATFAWGEIQRVVLRLSVDDDIPRVKTSDGYFHLSIIMRDGTCYTCWCRVSESAILSERSLRKAERALNTLVRQPESRSQLQSGDRHEP